MPIYYEAKALERAVDSAPRITPSTKSVLKKIIRSAPVADVEPAPRGVSLHDIYRVVAGHSYYYGGDILAALTCIAEGKNVNPVHPADAEPVVHGSWVPFHSQAAGNIWYCSACEIGFAARMKYCPNCGARMDAPSNLAELEDAERSRRIESLLKKGVTGW